MIAASALAVAAVAVGGTIASSRMAPDDGADSVVGLPADEPWAQRANSIFATWAGTPDEQQAAEVVVAHLLNGAYSECMTSKGFSRPWNESIAPAPVYKDPLLYSFWAANRLDGYFAQKVSNGEIGQRHELAANARHAEGDEAAAELACRRENPGASDEEVSAVRTPSVVKELLGGWSLAMAPVVTAGGDFETYDACMANTGVLKQLGVKSTEEARDQLSSLMTPGSVPLGDEPPTSEWKAYLEREHSFVQADWSCREGVRAGLGDEVSSALDDFEGKYSDQIQQARRHWDEVAAEASALGWSPDEPYAGATQASR